MTTTGKTFIIIGSVAAAGVLAFLVFKAVSPPPAAKPATTTPASSSAGVGDIAVKLPTPGLASISTTYTDPAVAYGSAPLSTSIGAGIL